MKYKMYRNIPQSISIFIGTTAPPVCPMLNMCTSEIAAELTVGPESAGEVMVIETTSVDVFVSTLNEVETMTVVALMMVEIVDVTIKVVVALKLLDPVPSIVTV